MLIHDCDNCERKGNCELQKMIAALREEYVNGGVKGLGDRILVEWVSLEKPNDKFQWLMSGVEAIGIKAAPMLADLAAYLRERTASEQHEELNQMLGASLNAISDVVMHKTTEMLLSLAKAVMPEYKIEAHVGDPTDAFVDSLLADPPSTPYLH